jgi:hypothetical protein
VGDATPAQNYTLVDTAEVVLDPQTTITFPADPVAIKAGVKTTASTPTSLNRSGGGNVEIDTTDDPIAAHIPNGAPVAVPAAQAAATVHRHPPELALRLEVTVGGIPPPQVRQLIANPETSTGDQAQLRRSSRGPSGPLARRYRLETAVSEGLGDRRGAEELRRERLPEVVKRYQRRAFKGVEGWGGAVRPALGRFDPGGSFRTRPAG